MLLLAFARGAEAKAVAGGVVVLVLERSLRESRPLLEQRTRSELLAAGFQVALVEAADTADLAQIAAEQRALAALRISHRDARELIAVHVADAATGRSSQRGIDVSSTTEPARIALRAVELLHASLLELEAARPAQRPSSPGPAPPPTRAVTAQASWAAGAGAFGLTSPGGVGTLAGIELELKRYIAPSFGIGLSVAASAPTVIREGASSASFAIGIARGSLRFEPWPTSLLSPGIGLQSGLLGGVSDGDSDVGAPTRTDFAGTSFVGLSLALASRLSPTLRVRGDLELCRAFDSLQLRFAQRRVAQLGQPWFGARLMLEWLH